MEQTLLICVCVRHEIAFLGEERNWEEAFKDQNVCPKGIYRPVRQRREGYKQLQCEWRKFASGWRGVCVDVCVGGRLRGLGAVLWFP